MINATTAKTFELAAEAIRGTLAMNPEHPDRYAMQAALPCLNALTKIYAGRWTEAENSKTLLARGAVLLRQAEAIAQREISEARSPVSEYRALARAANIGFVLSVLDPEGPDKEVKFAAQLRTQTTGMLRARCGADTSKMLAFIEAGIGLLIRTGFELEELLPAAQPTE